MSAASTFFPKGVPVGNRMLIVMAVSLFAMGCTKSSKSGGVSYSVNENGCSVQASSKADLCSKLENGTFGDSCEIQTRLEMYTRHSCDTASVQPQGTAGTVTTQRSSSYSYELSYNGCSTGKQTFSTRTAMCEGLRNDALNNGCAYSMRVQYAKQIGCQ